MVDELNKLKVDEVIPIWWT